MRDMEKLIYAWTKKNKKSRDKTTYQYGLTSQYLRWSHVNQAICGSLCQNPEELQGLLEISSVVHVSVYE